MTIIIKNKNNLLILFFMSLSMLMGWGIVIMLTSLGIENKCLETVKIVNIISVEGRSSHVLLSNGKTVLIPKETHIRQGSDFCAKNSV